MASPRLAPSAMTVFKFVAVTNGFSVVRRAARSCDDYLLGRVERLADGWHAHPAAPIPPTVRQPDSFWTRGEAADYLSRMDMLFREVTQ